MKNRPAYAIASVDSALLLASLLQQEGAMRVTDVAARLGVSVSTAHRLLGMLVYRDFAEQLPDRSYTAGPVLRRGRQQQAPVTRLRDAALPHLRTLVDAMGETANAMVLAGGDVRFVATVECDQVLRVGDRTGRALPAHLSSGGKAVLATLDAERLTPVVEALAADTAARLERELRVIRRRGYAVNDQATEPGLIAVGVAVPPAGGVSGAALSLAAPSARYSRDRSPAWASALAEAADAVARDLDTIG
ncbi:IclR family transcriptional regulator [Blastococcus brunescens]|uniref:IclR family transcriptional regulator C-terminal domain-containing protein n=1 Tax=Blastococcus brunescens TaxID=1564165 RepID=A0ABZ1B8Y1_9ACTN|nr:IclR family transcriptional regulator C-terminal domain-containing protein [Blastococcus sp. BMG 8361]WRL66576.1 IclR family transcriptional regulator C-terminal domain-containing protein [Blastococcus sp. BMG 8361]